VPSLPEVSVNIRTILLKTLALFIAMCIHVGAQEKTAPPTPEQQEKLVKPESDRGEEPLLRQQPLSFSNPDRDKLRRRIETALQREASLRGAELTVNVSEDAIDLTGVANNSKQRLAARRIVQSFAGNMRVRERISVAGAAPPPKETAPNPGPNQPASRSANQPLATAPKSSPQDPRSDPRTEGDKSDNPR
jgi:hypothetical protein